MDVFLSPWQTKVWNDTHRFRVVCAGRRSGKSVLSQLQILTWANTEVGRYWIVAPTYKQAKTIHWEGIQHYVPQKLVSKKNEVELSLTLVNGSVIELRGAENPDALRGVKLRGIVVDEIASIRNWDWLWSEVLRPTLTDYEAPALFISTPKGFNHFHDLYSKGQTGMDNYKSWRFTTYDNPYIPKGEIDNAKQELTEDTFAQEYLADFRKHTGLVYKEFQREVHVIDQTDVPETWTIYRCIDFGSTNPTACLWIACDGDDNWYIIAEHYQTGETIDYHAGIINANPYSKRVISTYGDPSGTQWIKEFAQRGIYITPANKEVGTQFNSWVRFGIEKVGERLKPVPGHSVPSMPQRLDLSKIGGSMPKLFVFNTCTNLIREFETYRWKEKSVTQAQDLNEPDVPEKANDHACFTKDTKIEVPFGEVIYTKYTGKKKVYKFMGSKVTADHPYLTQRGFIRLDSLRYSDRILVWRNNLLMELRLDGTQTHHMLSLGSIFHLLLRNYSAIRQNTYTDIYGKSKMARYLKACTFITKITIHLTTTYLISNLYHLKNTTQDIMMRCFLSGEEILKQKLDQKLLNGTNRKKQKSFISELLKTCGRLKNGLQRIVQSAIKNTKLHSPHVANSALLIAGLRPVGAEKVYAHASSNGFFLANGVVVSNCDALRYFAVSYKKQEPAYKPLPNDISRKNWSLQ